jgi:EAL domain-containing protein (putative c-di-GMP-specific phosphodiesterase class I)
MTQMPDIENFAIAINCAISRTRRTKHQLAILSIAITSEANEHDANMLSTLIDSCIRQGDVLAHIRDDQLLVLHEPVTHQNDFAIIAEKISKCILPSECCIGLSVFPGDGTEPETLINLANRAMRSAQQNKQDVVYNDQNLQQLIESNRALHQAFSKAIHNTDFELHYQPLFDFSNNQLVAVEALLRWPHPDKGLLNANNFLPECEQAGLLPHLSNWLISKACQQLIDWEKSSPGATNLMITINLNRHQVHKGLIELILLEVIEKTKIRPELITIEIDDRVFEEGFEATKRVLDYISDLGINIAFQNFGLNHTSLFELAQLPIRYYKIATHLVQNVTTGQTHIESIKLLMMVARQLSIDVVASGIENKEQYEALKNCGCDYAQGYYLQKPVPVNEISALFSD